MKIPFPECLLLRKRICIFLDLYNNLKEKSLKDKNIIVPKLDYSYCYNHYVRKGLINILKSYSEEISKLL